MHFSKKTTAIIFIISLLILLSVSVSALTLKKGDRGKNVEKIQRQLSSIGYTINIDGVYGIQTKKVIKDFQKNNNLHVDGKAGNNTINKIEKMVQDIKYTVKQGETLWEISQRFNSSIESIKETNNIKNYKTIKPGTQIYIPKTGSGGGRDEKIYSQIIHKVEPGDTLSSLAERYGTNVDTIKLTNNIKGNRIYVGDKLAIPRLGKENNQSFQLTKDSLIWPVSGEISSSYGWRTHPIRGTREFHNAIDIAVKLGSRIHAAASGKIIQSGWISGYGKTIIIDHGNNIKTLYAHNSSLLVTVGDFVSAGSIIARAGSTGASTGSHLHFEVQVNEKAVNPLKYLP